MTRLLRITVPLWAAFLAAGLSDSSARAQDLPSEGNFSITYTAVIPSPNKGIAVGKEREAVANASTMTAVNDAGSGLLHNMAGRCVALSTIDRVAKTLEVRGYCNYVDRSGDQVWEEFSTPAPLTLGTPVKFAGKWVGGTGKYTGLSGDFEITNSGPMATDGPAQSAGKKIGSYKISK
jgi:hypothetical protein